MAVRAGRDLVYRLVLGVLLLALAFANWRMLVAAAAVFVLVALVDRARSRRRA